MIKIWCISDGDKHFESAILEYKKRLKNYKCEIINYKWSKKNTPAEIIQEDTDFMIKKLQAERAKGSYIVLLSKEWYVHTTEQRRFMIASKQNSSTDIIFLIGWPYGFDERVLGSLVDTQLSFGAITMPHGLVKLVLVEQLYRCFQIMSWRNYHY